MASDDEPNVSPQGAAALASMLLRLMLSMRDMPEQKVELEQLDWSASFAIDTPMGRFRVDVRQVD